MATVVLLGCSTSGKSSAARRFAAMYGGEFEVVDSDALVAQDPEFRGDLYAMYLKFTNGGDTSAAQLYLELGERHLLRQLAQEKSSQLIAAGPNVPLREPEWSHFVQARNPICFFFRLSDLELFQGLKERRNRHRRRGLDLCSSFGAWDGGLATRFNEETKAWDELAMEDSLPLLKRHLARVEPIYSSVCEAQHIYQGALVKRDQEMQRRLASTLAMCLRWAPIERLAYETADVR